MWLSLFLVASLTVIKLKKRVSYFILLVLEANLSVAIVLPNLTCRFYQFYKLLGLKP